MCCASAPRRANVKITTGGERERKKEDLGRFRRRRSQRGVELREPSRWRRKRTSSKFQRLVVTQQAFIACDSAGSISTPTPAAPVDFSRSSVHVCLSARRRSAFIVVLTLRRRRVAAFDTGMDEKNHLHTQGSLIRAGKTGGRKQAGRGRGGARVGMKE